MNTFSKRYITRWTSGILIAATVISAAAVPALARNDQNLTKAERRRQKAIQKEMESPYKKWISGPISYIITPQERAAFKKLTTDEERDRFIEQFWERRNPTPGSSENAFKEEFYRRIAYANEHYSSGWPGWQTDRGRIYIMYGPPDSNESHPSGGMAQSNPGNMPWAPSGTNSTMATYPYEDWTYHYIPGIGNNVQLEFVDPTMTGEYHLTMNPCEKDAMAMVPNDNSGCAGLVSVGSIWNPMAAQFNGLGGVNNTDITSNIALMNPQMEEFNQLDLYAKIFQPPSVKFNDLKAVVTSSISAQLLPFSVRTHFLKVTDETVLVPITIQVPYRELQFANKDGVMHAVMDIYGQISTLGGRTANTFQQSVVADVPQHDFQSYVDTKAVDQRTVYLSPGHYKLSIVIKDDQSGHMGSMDLGILVPQYTDDKLSTSSLILADLIQPLPTSNVGSGPFVIGGTKVRPSVNQTFTQKQNLGIYMQVYNLGLDPQTHRPSAEINYQIFRDGKAILNQTEQSAQIKDAAEQMTIEKTLPVRELQPGRYSLHIKITDKVKNQTDTQTANFQVE
jgi:GWxTD domain-containing protein